MLGLEAIPWSTALVTVPKSPNASAALCTMLVISLFLLPIFLRVKFNKEPTLVTVSYTHLTLPTILPV